MSKFKKGDLIRPKEGTKTSNKYKINKLELAEVLGVYPKKDRWGCVYSTEITIKPIKGYVPNIYGTKLKQLTIFAKSFVKVDKSPSSASTTDFQFQPVESNILTLLALQAST
jgi:hypothetical protein